MPRQNAFIEVNNLLATTQDIFTVTPQHLLAIGETYNVDIYGDYSKDFQNIFADYLRYCLQDCRLSKEEINNLRYLQKLFYLSSEVVKKIQQQVCQEIYAKKAEEAVSDGNLDQQEKEQLDRLQKYFQIDDNDIKQLYGVEVKKVLDRQIDEIVANGKLSPDKEKQFYEIAKNLGANITFDEDYKKVFDILRLFWRIESGELPEYDVQIVLQAKEKCHLHYGAKWHEYRKVTRRIRYGGPTLRIKIMKGVYWRAGDIAVQSISEDVLTQIDSGVVFITNKRILFKGNMKSLSFNLNKIIDYVPYKNGIEIQRSTGKTIFFEIKEELGIKIFCMTLERLLRSE
jgi:hypothetical protein